MLSVDWQRTAAASKVEIRVSNTWLIPFCKGVALQIEGQVELHLHLLADQELAVESGDAEDFAVGDSAEAQHGENGADVFDVHQRFPVFECRKGIEGKILDHVPPPVESSGGSK